MASTGCRIVSCPYFHRFTAVSQTSKLIWYGFTCTWHTLQEENLTPLIGFSRSYLVITLVDHNLLITFYNDNHDDLIGFSEFLRGPSERQNWSCLTHLY
jgi:hypothetical protein